MIAGVFRALGAWGRSPASNLSGSLLAGQALIDLAVLRAHGFSDEDILDIVHVMAYFNYINRVADSLGVDPEPDCGFEPMEITTPRRAALLRSLDNGE